MIRPLMLMVLGMVLLGAAAPPNQKAQAEQSNTASEVDNRTAAARVDRPKVAGEVKAVEAVEPPEYYNHCERDQDQRKSDLCAQWKAADSAYSAAQWAMWSLVLGVIGTLGLFATLYWTRKAVHVAMEATKDADAAIAIAARNADAAAALVEVSREVHMAQTRPWVFVKDITIVFEHMKKANAVVFFHNYGNWPATNFSKTMHARQMPYPFAALPLEEPDQSLATVLPPSCSETMVVEDLPRRKPGHAVRVDIAWSYKLPDGSTESAHETFVIDVTMGEAGARKMTAYDSASHSAHARKGE